MRSLALISAALSTCSLCSAFRAGIVSNGVARRSLALRSSNENKGILSSVNIDISEVKERFGDILGGAQKNLQEGQVGDRGEGWTAGQAFLLLCIAAGGLPIVGGLLTTVAGPGLFFGGVAVMVWSVVELGSNLTPFPAPTEDNILRTTGPYAFVRHPIYSGLIAAAFGLGVISHSVDRLLLAGILAVFLDQKASKEEEFLSEKHLAYDLYKEEVAKFIPTKLGL